jgi:hypothetical protein
VFLTRRCPTPQDAGTLRFSVEGEAAPLGELSACYGLLTPGVQADASGATAELLPF